MCERKKSRMVNTHTRYGSGGTADATLRTNPRAADATAIAELSRSCYERRVNLLRRPDHPRAVQAAGVVGAGGAGFPTHIKHKRVLTRSW